MQSRSISRIAHWVGVTAAAVIAGIACVAFYDWLRGGFPPTVTTFDAVLVLLLLMAGAALSYVTIRAIGWSASAAFGRDKL